MTDQPGTYYTGRLPFVNLARYGPGVTLQVVDFAVWEAHGTADATGTVELLSDPVPGDEYWLIERVLLDSSSNYPGRLDVYEGSTANVQCRRDWSPIPIRFPLHRPYVPPVLIRSNREALFVITNLAENDVIVLSVTYVVVKKVGAAK